jgi:hypothetical protein
MRECVETHEQCEHRSTLQPWMPTRLLEINMQGEGVVVRLHITSKEDTGPYITLSHRVSMFSQLLFLSLLKT